MSDEGDWGDVGEAKKSRWNSPVVMGCGLGCLGMLGLVGYLAYALSGVFGDAQDSELQWGNLAKVMPHEERPPEWELLIGLPINLFGVKFEIYSLTQDIEEDGYYTGMREVDFLVEEWEPDFFEGESWQPADREEPVTHIEVGERTLPVAVLEEEGVRSLIIGVIPEGSRRPVMVNWTEPELESLTVERVVEFFSYFDLDL